MSTEFDVWKARWDNVEQSIQDLRAQLAAAKLSSHAGPTLDATLASLASFGRNQFNFFYNGFKDQYLETSPQFSADYVLHKILQQVSIDVSVLQLAISQRTQSSKDDHNQTTLAKADQLAYKALKPAIGSNILDNTTVITYIQKSPSIRLIPYAPVAVIGIPLQASFNTKNPDAHLLARDLLAIAHEVGHYVFRHGTFNGERIKVGLRDRLTACEPWLYRWKEEIFSDVYGACVAGPVMALDFQDLTLAQKTSEYLKDDSDHPIPALRPDVYHMALRASGQSGAVNNLSKRWDQLVSTRVNTSSFTTFYGNNMSLEDARHEMKTYIDAIVEPGTWPSELFGAERWTRKRAVKQLYQEFYEFTAACTENIPTAQLSKDGKTAKVAAHKSKSGKDTTWNFPAHEWQVGHYAQRSMRWMDTIRQQGASGKTSSTDRIPPEVWSQILMTNNWITGVGNENAYPT